MYNVARSALVMHSAEDMYSLVNDIESYPTFLPWCEHSQVLERTGHEMLAQVRIAFKGVKKSFTTRNQLAPFETIAMTLVDGPFSELRGDWQFKPLQPDACRIALNLRFGFSNVVAAQAIGPVFKHIADSLVDSFVKRAGVIHGRRGYLETGRILREQREPLPHMFSLEVVYALPERQMVERLELNPPVTIERAIRASSLLRRFPQIDLANTAVGVFGVERPLRWVLEDQDRVEIYRPLKVSPGDARRRRAG